MVADRSRCSGWSGVGGKEGQATEVIEDQTSERITAVQNVVMKSKVENEIVLFRKGTSKIRAPASPRREKRKFERWDWPHAATEEIRDCALQSRRGVRLPRNMPDEIVHVCFVSNVLWQLVIQAFFWARLQ